MSITITGIISTQAIESLGRRRVTQFGQLDQMQCVFFGPGATFSNFPINASHPEYPLMFITGAQASAIPGNLAEIQVNYEGKLLTNGASSYITYPVTSETPVQGSRDFSMPWMAQTSAPVYEQIAGPGGVITGGQGAVMVAPAFYAYGTQSVAVRYVGTQCSVRYQSYPRPSGLHYAGLGKGRVKWTILSITYGARSVSGSNLSQSAAQAAYSALPNDSTVPPLFAANLGFEITQRGKWYDCTEIYGPTF